MGYERRLLSDLNFPIWTVAQVKGVEETSLVDGQGDAHQFVIVNNWFALLLKAKGLMEEHPLGKH